MQNEPVREHEAQDEIPVTSLPPVDDQANDTEADSDAADFSVTQFIQGKGLKTEHIEPGQTEWFTVIDVGWITYDAKNGRKADTKPLLTLDGEDNEREWSLNVTNTIICNDAWGDDMRQWIGKKIGAYHDRSVQNPQGGRSGGLRVRIR